MSGDRRWGVRAYALLLRLMPPGFRRAHGKEALTDLTELLGEAGFGSALGTTTRACLDLLGRLPREWWRACRTPRRTTNANRRPGRPGRREWGMKTINEIRLAARSLARRPGFTSVAALTLALGIGANVAIFSIVDAVLLRPLPYPESERIVEFRHHAPGLDLPELMNSEGMLAYYRERGDFYTVIGAFGRGPANLVGDGEASRVEVAHLAPQVFEVLGVVPFMGRPFNEADASENRSDAVILPFDGWRTRFGGDPGVVGRTIELDGEAVEIVGVMPEGFAFPNEDVELYRASWVDPEGEFGTFGTRAVARLAPGVSVEAAQARSTALLANLGERFPDLSSGFLESSGFSVTVTTLHDRLVDDVRATLWIVTGAVAFILLIACANVANLFLIRAESRQKEMAVRAALGAGRGGVALSFLGESVLLGTLGGVLGVVFARWGLQALLAVTELPRAREVSLGSSSLLLAALLSVAAGVVFGALPMTRFAGRRFAAILRDGGRGSTDGRSRHRVRNSLVAVQLALAMVLLVGSGLMLRSFAELRAVDVGFDPEGVLVLGLSRDRGEIPEIAARFYQDVADRIAAMPGVETVGITTHVPLGSGNANGGSFSIDGRPREEGELPPVAMYRAVGASYFASLDIPIVAGRDMERADWEDARPVVWVNETFARTYFDGDALGERISWGNGEAGEDGTVPWAEIVGVVGDVRQFGLRDDEMRADAYFPMRTAGSANVEVQSASLTIEMAAGQSPTALAPAARAAVAEIDARVPIRAATTMDEVVAGAMESTSVTMAILAVATAMALFLGAIGLAGVIGYVVGQRTREIGVRVALGARSSDVSRLILGQSLAVVGGGTVFGLGAASVLSRFMESALFGVSASDPVTFVAAPLVLVSVSLLATWLPVRRATGVDPTEALRSE